MNSGWARIHSWVRNKSPHCDSCAAIKRFTHICTWWTSKDSCSNYKSSWTVSLIYIICTWAPIEQTQLWLPFFQQRTEALRKRPGSCRSNSTPILNPSFSSFSSPLPMMIQIWGNLPQWRLAHSSQSTGLLYLESRNRTFVDSCSGQLLVRMQHWLVTLALESSLQ